MTFEEIAKSFIVSGNFKNMIKSEHTILTGPRGCGKTTLLKMLHPKALNSWNTLEAEEIKQNIDFTGIYIPSDMQWKSQLDAFEKRFSNNQEFVENIFRGVINSNVLIAVCSTFSALIESSNVEEEFEIELALKLIDNWDIERPVAPNLDDIMIKILKMISNFNSFYRKKITSDSLPEFCYKNYFDLVSVAIACFESLNKRGNYTTIDYKNKWALCFDELEIMPDFFQKEIINQGIRGISDQRLLLKLTSVPNINRLLNKDILTPREIDDYTNLKLWVYNKTSQEEWRDFCEKYMKNILESYYSCKINLNTLLGKELNYVKGIKAVDSTIFAKSKSKQHSEFDHGGVIWKVMYLLQNYDKSFYEYLIRKNINPLDPVPKDKGQEAAIHRKIMPIVLYRYYFTEKAKSSSGKEKKSRSRNINAFNNGKNFIFDIADGNPRAFAHLVNEFIDKVDFDNNNSVKEIEIQKQSRIIQSFSVNYFYRRLVNDPQNEINNIDKLLFQIIDIIGNYFFKKLVLDDFSADPVNLFYVNQSEHHLKEFINIALKLGAIFKVEDELSIKEVRNSKDVYRLSYSLYPAYKLPKVDYNPIPLSRILKSENEIEEKATVQPSLFPDMI
jgi:energy-coupling factor transporter ATP-binding protein EcfA2